MKMKKKNQLSLDSAVNLDLKLAHCEGQFLISHNKLTKLKTFHLKSTNDSGSVRLISSRQHFYCEEKNYGHGVLEQQFSVPSEHGIILSDNIHPARS